MINKKLSYKNTYIFLKLIINNNKVDKYLLKAFIFITKKIIWHLFINIFFKY